jgi:ATP-binding cassette subfamily C protein
MRTITVFARAYPRHTATLLGCLLLAGFAEGIGISSLLPLLAIAAQPEGQPAAAAGGLQGTVARAITSVGLSPTTGVLLSMIVGGMLLKAGLVLLANKQVGYAVAHVATELRLSLIRALLRTRWEYYVRQPIGAFANAVANEARRGSETYMHAAKILSLLLQSGVYAIVAFLVSWQVALLALVAGALIVYALSRLVRMARRAGARQTRFAKSLVGRLTDTLQAVKPLRAMAREGIIEDLLENETHHLNRALEKEVLSKEALSALQEPLIVVFLAAGLYGALTVWGMPLATVIMLALLCGRIVAGLGQVQKEVQRLVACESAYWSLREMIDIARAAEETKPGARTPALERGVTLKGVGFRYGEKWVLRGADLFIPAGRLTVVVGPSGAGKTTLADLIIGLLEPQEGEVLVDGEPLGRLDAERWRHMIGYMPQEVFLLHDSVRQNVTLGDPDLSPADAERALAAAGAWSFVSALPEGMESTVGERGLAISGGQRQRIALARALVHRPELLILDEATTALDPATEASICETLSGLRGEVTMLAICHHGPLVDAADDVYEVADGQITALPSHAAREKRAGQGSGARG